MRAYATEVKANAVMEYVTVPGRTHLQIGLAYDVPNRAISEWCRDDNVIGAVAKRLKRSPESVRNAIKSKSEAAKASGRLAYKNRFRF